MAYDRIGTDDDLKFKFFSFLSNIPVWYQSFYQWATTPQWSDVRELNEPAQFAKLLLTLPFRSVLWALNRSFKELFRVILPIINRPPTDNTAYNVHQPPADNTTPNSHDAANKNIVSSILRTALSAGSIAIGVFIFSLVLTTSFPLINIILAVTVGFPMTMFIMKYVNKAFDALQRDWAPQGSERQIQLSRYQNAIKELSDRKNSLKKIQDTEMHTAVAALKRELKVSALHHQHPSMVELERCNPGELFSGTIKRHFPSDLQAAITPLYNNHRNTALDHVGVNTNVAQVKTAETVLNKIGHPVARRQ